MKVRRVVAVGVALVALLAGCSNGRFGDSKVIDQIKSSTDCAELHRLNDRATLAASGHDADWTSDQAAGYLNASNERMRQLGC